MKIIFFSWWFGGINGCGTTNHNVSMLQSSHPVRTEVPGGLFLSTVKCDEKVALGLTLQIKQFLI